MTVNEQSLLIDWVIVSYLRLLRWHFLTLNIRVWQLP